jgi:hypothetical protein
VKKQKVNPREKKEQPPKDAKIDIKTGIKKVM